MLPKIAELGRRRASRAASAAPPYRPPTMGSIDRLAFRYVGVSLMRDQLISLLGRLDFIDFGKWGPGRVDTFDPPKALLGFRMDTANAESSSTASPISRPCGIRKRGKGMWLHWDGNNCSVDERNLSAGFGTGATPATIDREP